MTDKPQPANDSKEAPSALHNLWRRRQLFSPLGLVARAALIALVYAVAHILGWQEYVSFVFATSTGSTTHAVMGLIYVTAYLGFVLVAPLLTIAAVIMAILLRMIARTR